MHCGCSNRHCPSHRQARLTQILKQRHENRSTSSHSIYSKPVDASIVLKKHQAFIDRWTQSVPISAWTFRKNNLDIPLQHRLVPIVLVDQLDRMKHSQTIRIPQLRIDHTHVHRHLSMRIVSKPLWTRYAVHVVVQDETAHCLRLSIYNWSYTFEHRQIFSDPYIEDRLYQLLPINSTFVLFDPWLKKCDDGDVALRCESPNINLFLLNFHTRCALNARTNIEDLRRLGNDCYGANDSLGAIEYYSFALQQLNEQTFVTADGRTNLTPLQRQQHRIRLLANRSACYLRERHPTEALEDTNIYAQSSLPDLTEKLLHRHVTAQLQLGHFDAAKKLLDQYPSLAPLAKDLHRLQEDQYDLPKLLQDQMSSPFYELGHTHREHRRTDLFEIRGSPASSYGAYALQPLLAGTLLLVEASFASVERGMPTERWKQSIHLWQQDGATLQYCSDDVLRLLNEVEKQLLIGNGTRTMFDRIQRMQPIRQWIAEQATSAVFSIPWRILFETQQQNPFQSTSTLA